MSGERRTPPADPTAERTADQSTQSAGGLHRRVDGPAPGTGQGPARDADDTAYRNDQDLYTTPRRYDSEDNDSDSSVNTKI